MVKEEEEEKGKCRLAFDQRDWDAGRKETGAKTGDGVRWVKLGLRGIEVGVD